MRALIVLEDGAVFEGSSFGASGTGFGEIVFNTGMAGYQEILTDPSYKGQIVTMTYPLIGNYGVNPLDCESKKPFVEGFVVKECSRVASNWRSQKTLSDYLKENNIPGIEGVDTRAITRHIRLRGAMKAVISTGDLNEAELIKKAKDSPGLVGRDLVKDVTCEQAYIWRSQVTSHKSQVDCLRDGQVSRISEAPLRAQVVSRPWRDKTKDTCGNGQGSQGTDGFKVVVLDCGVKYNILRELVNLNCQVTVVPARTTSQEILDMKPDGVLLSNGPGDPEGIPYAVKTTRELIGKLPLFGICMGNHMLTMALGGKMTKLKFGHHGGNHPVKDLRIGKVFISVQNHGFCCDIDSLKGKGVEITHINLNDNTLEGIRHKELPVFSVQFHPEASPGPRDTQYLFREFVEMMRNA